MKEYLLSDPIRIFPDMELEPTEACVLDEIIYRISCSRCKLDDNIPWVSIKSTDFSAETSRLHMVKVEAIRKALASLQARGLLIRRTSGLKSTIDYTPNLYNISLRQMLGEQHYLMTLSSHRGGGFEGMFCSMSRIENIHSPKNFELPGIVREITSYSGDVSCIMSDRLSGITRMLYTHDIAEMHEHADNGTLNVDGITRERNSEFPMNISMLTIPSEDLAYNLSLISPPGVIPLAVAMLTGDLQFSVEGEMRELKARKKQMVPLASGVPPPPKQPGAGGPPPEIFSDYIAYCKYLKCGDVLRKPVEAWTCADFVVYFYCGMAKLRGTSLVLPNFPRDCTQMKQIMQRYGSPRLKELIYTMVKYNGDIVEEKKMPDFASLTMSTLSVDWIMERVCEFHDSMGLGGREASVAVQSREKEKAIADAPMAGDRLQKLQELRSKYNREKTDGKEEKVDVGAAG